MPFLLKFRGLSRLFDFLGLILPFCGIILRKEQYG